MAKRRIAKIVRKACGLYQIEINLGGIGKLMGEKGANGPPDLPDLNAMRQTGSIEIVLAGAEDLRLCLKTTERAAMDNPISINSERTTVALSS